MRIVVTVAAIALAVTMRAISEAEAWIRELGYDEIHIDSRLKTIAFYEKLGYKHLDDEIGKSGNFDCIKMVKRGLRSG